MNTLEYLAIEKQIEKLKLQSLNIIDEEYARSLLLRHGYYNIINGYRDPYIFINEKGEKQYYRGVTFEQIYNLFIFDQTIRDAIMMSMVDLEDHLKAVTSDIIGSSFGVDHRQYLARNNYRDKYVSNPKFSRNEILYTLSQTARRSQKEPLKHYRENYGILPPWILFKDTYFATLVNLIRFFKKPEREALIFRLYGTQITPDNMDEYKNLLSDTLFMCLDYRNRTAHGGRIYNYIPQNTLRPFMGTVAPVGLPQLVDALSHFEYEIPVRQIHDAISEAINHYCSFYPTAEDIKRIEQATGFTITQERRIWANTKTKTFHRDRYCSGARNLKHLLLDDVLQQEYTPCKRCYDTHNK